MVTRERTEWKAHARYPHIALGLFFELIERGIPPSRDDDHGRVGVPQEGHEDCDKDIRGVVKAVQEHQSYFQTLLGNDQTASQVEVFVHVLIILCAALQELKSSECIEARKVCMSRVHHIRAVAHS